MVFWSLAVQSIKFVSWLNFSEMGGSIFPDCWFSQAVISKSCNKSQFCMLSLVI